MDGLKIGLDINDDDTQIYCCGSDRVWSFPTVICRKKGEDDWYIGEEAYGRALTGEGVIVDKLLKLVQKDGTSTIGEERYTGLDLLKIFLKRVLECAVRGEKNLPVEQLAISLPGYESRLLDSLMYCADYMGIPRERVHIISRTESFVSYVLGQTKEVWNNQVGLFDLSNERLCYYEMKVQRGMKKTTVTAECESLDEGFNLEILETSSGGKLGDKILCSCGERLLRKKLFSSIFLTGKGFERQDWAGEFMKLICPRRKVFVEQELFSRGAAMKALEYSGGRAPGFACICEGRLHSTVSMKVVHRDRESQLIVAAAGDSWYESKSTLELIPDGQDYVEFLITSADAREKRTVKIPLEGFPQRPNKTTRLLVSVGFLDENTMAVVIKDKGFGDLFPASPAVVRQEVMI